jgi:hypothetical protein
MNSEPLDQDAPQTSRSSGNDNHRPVDTLIAACESADAKL